MTVVQTTIMSRLFLLVTTLNASGAMRKSGKKRALAYAAAMARFVFLLLNSFLSRSIVFLLTVTVSLSIFYQIPESITDVFK